MGKTGRLNLEMNDWIGEIKNEKEGKTELTVIF